MKELQTITIKEYLNGKGIAYRESGKELITPCLLVIAIKTVKPTKPTLLQFGNKPI